MRRQALFGVVPGLALAWWMGAGAGAQGGASNGSAAAPRPPVELSLSRLTPDAVLPIAFEPGAFATEDAIWVPNRSAGTIIRIAAKDNTADPPVAVGKDPCASIVVAFNSVWVPACGDHVVARIDAKERKVSATLTMDVAQAEGRIASSVGSLWILTDRKGVLSRVDPDTNATVAEVYVPGGATAVAAGDATLWVTSEQGNRLTRVNPHTNEIAESVEVGPKPGRLVVGEGGVWTLNRGDGSVTRVDPKTNKVVATIPVDAAMASGDIAAGAGSVWLSAAGTPIARIDSRSNRAVQRFTGPGGGAILVAHGSVWVAAGPQLTWRLDPALVSAVRP